MTTGGWQVSVGTGLHGKTLGLLGLGRQGTLVARIGQAFGMATIAWSQNLTAERAAEHGVRAVAKEQLFTEADVLSIHVALSERTLGIVGAAELRLLKPTALLVNTSRGPIVNEHALIDVLRAGTIGGAALDAYDIEPLPPDHPLRSGATHAPHAAHRLRDARPVFDVLPGCRGGHRGIPGRHSHPRHGRVTHSSPLM
jgi:phosphoglycerate dehydrogenase-like enzyme